MDLAYDCFARIDSLLSPALSGEFLALFAWFVPLRAETKSAETDTPTIDSLDGAKRDFDTLKADFKANPSKYMKALDLIA
jgi:hypothetical protein